jgi:lipoprotein-anchoring transpeptidase ErfK/SrfK
MSSGLSRRALAGGLLALPAIIRAGTAEARQRVSFPYPYPAGSIIVSVSQRQLYLSLGDGSALTYPVAVGRPGKQWFGQRVVDGKHVRPAWSPPDEVRRDNPRLPDVIPGGVAANPMGERAITLSPGQYAIHGTNVPGSIGRPASYGCIRMYNHDIVDLFDRVTIGSVVTAVR